MGRNMQQKLADKVLRFHVLANSDSEVDQQLKYQVRDAVGCYLQKELGTADSREESEQIITGQLEQIQEVAEETVKEHGYSYSVRAELEETAFPVKSYGSFTFPSGTYEALRVVSGRGKVTTGGVCSIRISALRAVCMRFQRKKTWGYFGKYCRRKSFRQC